MESEWKEGTLGDFAEVLMGQSPPGADCSADPVGPPLLNGPTEFGSHSPTATQFTNNPKRMSEAGDLLFCVRGSTTGRMNWADQEYAIGRGLAAIRHKEPDCQQYLRGVIDYRLDELLSVATGSTFPNVSRNQILGIVVNIPPLPEQKAIAHILGTLDDKIELNRRMNATLEGMAQALFKSWFVDFDPVIDNALAAGNPIPDELAPRAEARKKALSSSGEPSRTNATTQQGSVDHPTLSDPKSLFPATFEFTEELGWIPEGWEVKPLSDAIQINPSVKLSKGTVAQFAEMKALPTSGYAIDGVIEKEYSGGAKFQNDDVLFARITPCLENGKTGIVDFLPTPDEVGFGSTEFIVLRGKSDLTLPYVACLARDETFRLHCKQSMVGSSGRQRVQNACFESFHVAIPTEASVLKSFDAVTTPMFRKSSEHGKASAALTKLRDTLLPKLISGELELPAEKQPVTEAI